MKIFNFRQKFNAWLLSFSYTFKYILILFLGYLPCAIILFFIYFLFIEPIKSLNSQTKAIEFTGLINDTVEQIFHYVSWVPLNDQDKNKEKLHELKQKIRNNFLSIEKEQKKFKNQTPLNEVEIQNISLYIKEMKDHWESKVNLSEHNQESSIAADFKTLIDVYIYLLERIMKYFNLSAYSNYYTHIYVQNLMKTLPNFQKELYIMNTLNLPASQLTELETESTKNTFVINSKTLVQSLETALNLDPTLPKDHFYKEMSVDLFRLKQSINHFLSSIGLNQTETLTASHQAFSEMMTVSFSLQQTLLKQTLRVMENQRDKMQRDLYIIYSLIVFGGSVAATLYLTRVIRKPLANLLRAADAFSKGNLSVRLSVEFSDEVGEITKSFNQMVEYFERILKNASVISEQIVSSSTTIFETVKNVENNVTLLDRIIREISSNAHLILNAIQNFSDDLHRITKNASLTSTLAATGRENLKAMEHIMQLMFESSTNIVKTLSSLQGSISNINQVIEAVIKIADQSNLLSLNAAIRANKSGEQGRGFVVIADKIREMANQIACATLDIERKTQEIIGAATDSVKEVDQFSLQIQKQVQETNEINEEFNNLINNTQTQIADFEDLKNGIQEQILVVQEINKAIEMFRKEMQYNTSAIKKLYAEFSFLHESSQSLRSLTESFQFKSVES